MDYRPLSYPLVPDERRLLRVRLACCNVFDAVEDLSLLSDSAREISPLLLKKVACRPKRGNFYAGALWLYRGSNKVRSLERHIPVVNDDEVIASALAPTLRSEVKDKPEEDWIATVMR